MSDAPSLLELMSGAPIYSESFEFKGQRVKFKLLDEREIDWCRIAAQKMSYRRLLREFDDDREIALDLLKNHSINYDSHTDWHDIFVLSMALKAEDGAPLSGSRDPYSLAERVADAFTPAERAHLLERYLDFVDENDPNALSDEDIKALIDDIKKKQSMDSLTRLGSRALRILLLTLVTEMSLGQGASAMDKSLDGT